MNTMPDQSNFIFLKKQTEQLWRLGALAERYFPEDPNDEPASLLPKWIQVKLTLDQSTAIAKKLRFVLRMEGDADE